jgi:hypothetical protein
MHIKIHKSNYVKIQSLTRRGMLEKLSYESETVFTIPPMFKQYVKMVAE